MGWLRASWALVAVALAVATTSCSQSPDAKVASAATWPEADALFKQRPRWLGGDAAYSVDLGSGRSLWMFGDSFVATSAKHVRSESVMVRNSVALQTGSDPSSASMEFAWRGSEQEPSSYFPEDGAHWFWPLHGIALGDRLTVFLMRMKSTGEGSFGFEATGTVALGVDDVSGAVDDWTWRPIELPALEFPAVIGSAVLEHGSHVYAYTVEEPGDHDVYLLRWPKADFEAGGLAAPTWWSKGGWVEHAELGGRPTPVFRDAQTELSVTHDPRSERFVEVQSRGFGSTTIAVRFADRPEGPWSKMHTVFRPAESSRDDAFVYAGKGHGQLDGADLLVTYASNAKDFGTLIGDTSLYYPRFVRLRFVEKR